MLVWFTNRAIKLFQYCFIIDYYGSIVFDLHNKELCDEYLRLNVIYDARVGLQLRALWSEVLACFANCWQKIVISPQEMLANIWHYR